MCQVTGNCPGPGTGALGNLLGSAIVVNLRGPAALGLWAVTVIHGGRGRERKSLNRSEPKDKRIILRR